MEDVCLLCKTYLGRAADLQDAVIRSRPDAREKRRDAPRTAPRPRGDEIGAADVARRVADNLRQHRKQRDMSLDQLSHATGVSRAALSQIETRKDESDDRCALEDRVRAGRAFLELIGESRLSLSVLRRDDTQVLRSTDRRFESRPLVPAAGVNEIEMYELTLSARSRHASEPHGPGTKELVVVLSGALRMTVGDHTDELEAGDSVVSTPTSRTSTRIPATATPATTT